MPTTQSQPNTLQPGQTTQINPSVTSNPTNTPQVNPTQAILQNFKTNAQSQSQNFTTSMTAGSTSKSVSPHDGIGKISSDTVQSIAGLTGNGDAPKLITADQITPLVNILQSQNSGSHGVVSSNQPSPQGFNTKQSYNGFAASNCTSYASWYWTNVLGKPFKDTSPGEGNAANWSSLARQQGYQVSSTPKAGDIVCWSQGYGVDGHVAIVQGVNNDGTINVSEFNYKPGQYDTRSNVSVKGAQFIS